MRIVIIGAGAAGLSVVEQIIRKNNNYKNIEITLLSNEEVYPYYRPFLSKFFGIKNIDISKFYLRPEKWYIENNVNIKLNVASENVDFEKKEVYTNKGKFSYDKLVITSGSRAFELPTIDYSIPGIYKLFTYEDVLTISKYVEDNHVKKALVIGGGILGCESANGLIRLKIEVDMVEMLSHIMPRMLTQDAATYLQEIILNKNVNIHTGTVANDIKKANNQLQVTFSSGEIKKYDLVIVNVGARPNLQFLDSRKIDIHRGLVCNDELQTSIEDVYAAGDIIEVRPFRTPMLWEPAQQQGEILAHNLLNKEKIKYQAAKIYPVFYNSFGIVLTSYGYPETLPADINTLFFATENDGKKGKVFVYYNDDNEIYFAAAFNNSKANILLRKLSKGDKVSLEDFEALKT